jgi:aspartyl-tRNA(Asn)/glutamyl-tRNA(Gln) amidotransferase subunit B
MDVKIGLEVHVQLTEAGTKLFCGCKANYRGMEPNTNVCPVCLGLPGALPVPQRRPLLLAVAASLALNCEIPKRIVFTRKHYFYPDLPKNYQITQYKGHGAPVCLRGKLRYLDPDEWSWKEVKISRINLEEDPGRSVYEKGGILRSRYVYVDYNRSGVPLLEIVTEPMLKSAREARRFVEALLLTLEYIGATNPRLEGAFRVDANVSVAGGERVEVKNIGSTLDLEKAINYEILRQKRIVENGGKVRRETRHWDPVKGVTRPLRYKEEESEYLYMPEPDIPPVPVAPLLKEAKRLAKESPWKRFEELVSIGIPREHAWSIVQTKTSLELFLEALRRGGNAEILSKLVAVDLKGEMKKIGRAPYEIESWPPVDTLVKISQLVEMGSLTYDYVKLNIVPKLARDPKKPLEELLPKGKADPRILANLAIKYSEKAVKDFMNGRRKALEYIVGVGVSIALAKGLSVDPKEIRKEILKILSRKSKTKH